MSIIACAFALLIFCIRAATAQEVPPPAGAQSEPYGMVPMEKAQPDSQPYGIKPIPGYTPPAPLPPPALPVSAQPVSAPPDALRGSVTDNPATPARQAQDDFGYVPLRAATPAPTPVSASPSARQPPAGYGAAGYGPAGYGPTGYGYVPLRQTQPLAPPLRASTASGDEGDGSNMGLSRPTGVTPAAYQPTPGIGQNETAYRLGPGDKVRVTVFGESDLSGDYQVDGSGMVRLPLIGTLQASGVTAPALEQNIAATLEDGYIRNPRVNVEITLYRPFYIIGAVNRPGQYPYVDHMSALNAVALAGGFTDQAIQSSVYVRHEGSATEEAVETSQLTHIQPGDVVRVRTSPFWEAMNLFSPIAGPAAIAAAAWH